MMRASFNFLKYSAATFLGLGFAIGSAQALTITPTNDGNTLANNILGSGISIVPGSINYIGVNGAAGTFTNGLSSGIGIDQGIILTTGRATNAVGPNTVDNISENNSTPGDADLSTLIGGATTYDANILEFEFESAGGDLFFDYVFASEEYNEYVNSSFNDVFGFFLNGVNIALIPGTSTPVAINNVNLGSNSAFYNNNDPSDLGTPTPFNIQYDGFTKVFTAQVLGLTPGKHKIKLAIADTGDSILDSAVFIKASSFSDKPTDPGKQVPEPASVISLLTLGAIGMGSVLKSQKSS
ncbi:PEP-CTERM putative exosortase interaction domain-containing protein [Pleurocapsa sp. PCC 7327]|nr:choice-of-anchor L domain-containing protein [Pleurocapsa sp. PCC 7327]AFY76330.1 PEP-CTERM putative exosortase interaction domain-containing protein [Pleurocapsa sp. PCC 7327]